MLGGLNPMQQVATEQVRPEADLCKLLDIVYVNEAAAEVMLEEYLESIENNNLAMEKSCV